MEELIDFFYTIKFDNLKFKEWYQYSIYVIKLYKDKVRSDDVLVFLTLLRTSKVNFQDDREVKKYHEVILVLDSLIKTLNNLDEKKLSLS